MTQQFLNCASIEDAFDAYLTRWHLPSVQAAWADSIGRVRKPSLAQFTKRFGADYERRQKWLAKQDGSKNGTVLAILERDDTRQEIAENIVEGDRIGRLERTVERLIQAQSGGTDDEILGSDEPETRNGVLSILAKNKAKAEPQGKAGGPGHLADQVKDDEPTEKFVKPENFNELPSPKQVKFLLHRADEAGQTYAIVPLQRGVIAEVISQIKDDGRDYLDVAAALV